MRRALNIQADIAQIETIRELTSVFESIASIRISRTKDAVVSSSQFFRELWSIYRQLRVNPGERFGTHGETESKLMDRLKRKDETQRDVFVIITSEGGLSGDIDQKIVETVSHDYNPQTTDIVVVGAHGATILAQRKIDIAHYFKLPDDNDNHPDIAPIIEAISRYGRTTVYYETYVSLAVQDVAKIDLAGQVESLAAELIADQEIISTRDYLFEPSLDEVVDYMESIMLGVALSQVILESRLAQYASRFNAMTAAKRRAEDIRSELKIEFHRSKRSESDERLKEVSNSLGNL